METKCAAFWKHTNIRNSNKIFPCCRFKSPVAEFDGDVESILHSPIYQELREASSTGKFLEGCAKCYYEESQGKESLRQRFNKEYDTEKVELKFLELGLDNICNLTCDGCFGEFSSAWSEKEQPSKPKSFHIRSSNNLNSVPNTVDKILFLGGEPLMTKRPSKILEQVPDKSKVSVIYNTNGTFLLDQYTIDLLKTFKNVEFIVSIDGYAELNDQVRSGSQWKDILKFIEQIRSLSFELSVNSVLHLNNWQGFTDLHNFIKSQKLEWTINVLTYPKHLAIDKVENIHDVISTFENLDIPNKQYIMNHFDNIKQQRVNNENFV